MRTAHKRTLIALACMPGLMLPTAGALATGTATDAPQQQMSQRDDSAADLSNWDPGTIYANGWSASEMLDAQVRGDDGEQIGSVKDIVVGHDGSITKLIVEVGGFLEIGDQHIGVLWKDVTLGRGLDWIEVPLREVENGTYSIYGMVPQGEEVAVRPGSWRVHELIGEDALLADESRYGLVNDIIFGDDGAVRAVIVARSAGDWGPDGAFAYPYTGYRAEANGYPMPWRSGTVAGVTRFDYVRLGELSRFSNGNEERASPDGVNPGS